MFTAFNPTRTNAFFGGGIWQESRHGIAAETGMMKPRKQVMGTIRMGMATVTVRAGLDRALGPAPHGHGPAAPIAPPSVSFASRRPP
jgi:hypothetical protein